MTRGTRDTSRALQDFAYGAITLYGRSFQTAPLSLRVPCRGPTTPEGIASRRFGLIPVRSPLLRDSLLFSVPWRTKMFQFLQLSPHILFYSDMGPRTLLRGGFPIRKSPDQSLLSNSPKIFAANHVLHRLLPPRHSPFALASLTI